MVMPIPSLNTQQIGYKLLSMSNFQGRKGEEVTKTLISASLHKDSVENVSGAYNVSPQTVRNYVEEQGLQVAEKTLEQVKQISLETLKGVKEIELSIDWTTITWYGKPVEGLGSSEKGYSWNYATATTKYEGKILILAFIPQVNGMTKDEIVKVLIEQVVAMGFRIKLIALDAGFYTVEVIKFVSQFNYIIGVPVGDVKIYEEFDGEHVTNSKRRSKDEQVKFRLIVYRREKIKRKKMKVVYFARATNLDLPKNKVLELYNKVRNPIETSYRSVKSFLPFTCSTKFIFRMLIFLLAVLVYSLYTILKDNVKMRTFKSLISKIIENISEAEIYLNKSEETLTNTTGLFLRR
ncbi:ISH3 family transposase [Saccharolobus islandicus]